MKSRRKPNVDDMIKALTPEVKEEMKQKRLAALKAMTLEYQLGLFVGEYIVSRYLPSLSIDKWNINPKNIISVSPEETAEEERLTNIWFNKVQKFSKEECIEEWNESIAYRKALMAKYLPHQIKCFIYPLNYENEKELKRGIKRALWDSDRCNYKCTTDEDIVIEHDEEGYYTYVHLTLDLS